MKRYQKVVIDCDPGIDDCFALLMAMKHLEVVGITTVGGNTGLSNTTKNARYVTELAGRTDIPVYAGYDTPLLNERKRAEEIHGQGGIGTVQTGEPKKQAEQGHAADFIADTFLQNNDVMLVALGPLTNIAQSVLRDDSLRKRIPKLLIMGGSVTAGNYNATAEFNIYADPEAAKIVFDSGIPIQMVGLNLCRQNYMTKKEVESIRKMKNPVARFASEILDFNITSCARAQLCDACAISWLIDPKVIALSLSMHVEVETAGRFTRGMTVCDYRPFMGTEPKMDIGRERFLDIPTGIENAEVAMEFNRDRFVRLLLNTLDSYGD